MKKTFLIISSLLFSLSTFCQKIDMDLDLTGKVKNLTEVEYDGSEVGGKIIKESKKESHTSTFNEMRKRTEHVLFSQEGKIYEKEICKFDSEGKMIESMVFYSESPLFNKNLRWKYDNKGNMIEAGWYSKDNLYKANTFKYDEKGNKIGEYNPDGSIITTLSYKYDNKGNKIEETSFISENNFDYKSSFKYDDLGNCIENDNILQDGNIGSKTFFKYDKKNKIIEQQEVNADGSFIRKWTASYDENGNQTIYNSFQSDSIIDWKIVSKFDDKKNVIELTQYNGDGILDDIRFFQFIYDLNGNWIKRTEIYKKEEGNIINIFERELTYY
jgi:hypothetical protein